MIFFIALILLPVPSAMALSSSFVYEKHQYCLPVYPDYSPSFYGDFDNRIPAMLTKKLACRFESNCTEEAECYGTELARADNDVTFLCCAGWQFIWCLERAVCKTSADQRNLTDIINRLREQLSADNRCLDLPQLPCGLLNLGDDASNASNFGMFVRVQDYEGNSVFNDETEWWWYVLPLVGLILVASFSGLIRKLIPMRFCQS